MRGLEPSTSSLFEHRFDIDSDVNFITNHNPAAIHWVLPTNAKVLSINLRSSDKTRPRLRPLVHSVLPPRRWPLTQIADMQSGLAGNSADGQIASDGIVVFTFNLNFISHESNFGIAIHVKKICAAQMVITFLNTRPEFAGVDQH